MLFLLITLVSTPSFASLKRIPDDSFCAKRNLSAMYGAEKAYYSEYKVYADTYNDIGFAPEPGDCPSWAGSIRLFNGGQEFLATYVKASTGETWTINERKELRQTDEGKTRQK